MSQPADLEAIFRDPLAVHFALKARGSDFSKIARRLSRARRNISPCQVRAVVYGSVSANKDLILKEIRRVLQDDSAKHPRFEQA